MKIITFCHEGMSHKVPDVLFKVFEKTYLSGDTEGTFALKTFIQNKYAPIITDLMITDECFFED